MTYEPYELLVDYDTFIHNITFTITKTGVKIKQFKERCTDFETPFEDVHSCEKELVKELDSAFLAEELEFWLLHQDRKLWGSQLQKLAPELTPDDEVTLRHIHLLRRL